MKEVKIILKKLGKPAVATTVITGLFLIGFCGALILKLVSGLKAGIVNNTSLIVVSDRLDNAIETLRKRSLLREKIKTSGYSAAHAGVGDSKNAAPAGPTLRGVASNRGKMKVFLNDRILSVGDEFDGCTIVDVKKDSVILRNKDGHETAVSLKKE